MAKKTKKQNRSWKAQLFLVMGIIVGVVVMPTSFLLIVGMAPTPAAALLDRTKKKTKVLTVGAMNFAGCSPFLFDLWMKGHDFAMSMKIALDPKAIIVMYSAAGVGYLLDWAMTGVVSGVMVRRGQSRVEFIRERQAKLVERWGRKVTGELVLDPQGFPLENALPDEDTALPS